MRDPSLTKDPHTHPASEYPHSECHSDSSGSPWPEYYVYSPAVSILEKRQGPNQNPCEQEAVNQPQAQTGASYQSSLAQRANPMTLIKAFNFTKGKKKGKKQTLRLPWIRMYSQRSNIWEGPRFTVSAPSCLYPSLPRQETSLTFCLSQRREISHLFYTV